MSDNTINNLYPYFRSKEFAGEYEGKKIEMNKAQEETAFSYQKKKVIELTDTIVMYMYNTIIYLYIEYITGEERGQSRERRSR